MSYRIFSRLSRIFLAIFFFASAAHAADPTQSLKFLNQSRDKATLTIADITKKVPEAKFTVHEPHMQAEQVYVGVPFNQMMESVYGPAWKEAEEVLLICEDGYKASVPVARFQNFTAYFVYAMADTDKFEFTNKLHNNELTKLGPFYLIWDNIKSPELKGNPAGWPYQVVSIDLIRVAEKFPKLAPKKVRMTEGEQRGFIAYRTHCMSCHTINGEGGDLSGIELNNPVSVTQYWRNEWLQKWLLQPTAIRPKTKMPAFASASPAAQREAIVKDIITYLRLMSMHKL